VVEQIGDGAFSAGAKAGEPNDATGLAVALFAFLPRDGVFVPVDLNLLRVGHGGLGIRDLGIRKPLAASQCSDQLFLIIWIVSGRPCLRNPGKEPKAKK
jgi:hypothetical protein